MIVPQGLRRLPLCQQHCNALDPTHIMANIHCACVSSSVALHEQICERSVMQCRTPHGLEASLQRHTDNSGNLGRPFCF